MGGFPEIELFTDRSYHLDSLGVIGTRHLGLTQEVFGEECALYHQERYDGNGYPQGLAGQAIPLEARIVAVADTYDAMTSDRAYRRALPHEVTLSELERCCGSQFDPEIANTFISGIDGYRDEQRDLGKEVPE